MPESLRSTSQTPLPEPLRVRLLETVGWEIGPSAEARLRSALDRLLVNSPFDSPEALFEALLRPSPNPVFDDLVRTLAIGETYFFRYSAQFNALRERILPDLIAERRATGRRVLNLWSAGCATGEEPYSLAILLHDLLPDLDRWTVRIGATDLNEAFLTIARRAVYRAWSFRDVPTEVRDRAFAPAGDGLLALRPVYREMVRFSRLNLIEPDGFPAPGTMDLIICRNVTIYFSAEVTAALMGRFETALVPGGWLVVGHADPSPIAARPFELVVMPGTVLYRRRDPLAPVPVPRYQTMPRTTAATEFVRSTPKPTGAPPRRIAPVAAQAVQAPVRPVPPPAKSVPKPDLPTLERLAESAATDQERFEAAWRAALERTNRNDLGSARRLLETALSLDRSRFEPHWVATQLAQAEGNPDLALAAARRTLYLAPSFVPAHLTFALLLHGSGDGPGADRHFQMALDLTRDQPADAPLPLAPELTVGRVREIARFYRRPAEA